MIENPILKGFCPDPSIIRVEDDYYIATSSFEWWPGVKLFHSKDLKHWKQILSPLRRTSQLNMLGNPHNGGIWAPCLSYHDGTYFLTYTDVKTQKRPYYNTHNYLVWTNDIYGDWSDPLFLTSLGFDPSLFHAPNGKKYLVIMRNGFKGIYLQEFDFEQKALVGKLQHIFEGTEAGFTEGPHLYYREGYYYLVVAEGGTAYGHCVTMARSCDVWGPYEVDPKNPMLTSRDNDGLELQRAGHADLVETPAHEWYMVHLASRPLEGKHSVLGRETAIQKVRWNTKGWLELEEGGQQPQLLVPEPLDTPSHSVPLLPSRDGFDGTILQNCYTTLRTPLAERASLQERPGWLRLYGRESISSNHTVSLVALRQQDFACIAQTKMDFLPQWEEQAAGLLYLYNNESFYALVKTIDAHDSPILKLLKSDHRTITEKLPPIPIQNKPVHLRIRGQGLASAFFYSYDEMEWISIPYTCDGRILTDEHNYGFTGSHLALYAHDMINGSCFADFDYFEYRAL